MATRKRTKLAGHDLVDHIKFLARRGDVRRVCLLDEERSMLEIPMMTGDPASPATVLKAPVLAAIKAFSTLVNECTVEVEEAEKASREKV